MFRVFQEGLQPDGPGSKLITGKGRALDPKLNVTNDPPLLLQEGMWAAGSMRQCREALPPEGTVPGLGVFTGRRCTWAVQVSGDLMGCERHVN